MQADTPTPVRLTVVPTTPERCCRVCDYRPIRVAWLLRMCDTLAQSGYSPAEALQSVLADHETDARPALGERSPKAAQIVADLSRALRAGHRDPVSIARFLCPAFCEDADD
jgi:hypothetical protein